MNPNGIHISAADMYNLLNGYGFNAANPNRQQSVGEWSAPAEPSIASRILSQISHPVITDMQQDSNGVWIVQNN